jgi:two-component system, sensor histidine kinase ChiS
MRIFEKIFLFLLLIALSLPASAQKQEIKFEHIKEGLSQNTVYAIVQDQYGFMWFGTQDGLNQYDGYTFTHYRHDPENPDSLTSNFIFAIHEDRAGTLWIATDGGLDKYDRQHDKFIHYQHEPDNPRSLSNNVVLDIYEDSKGILWISTEGGGLNRFLSEKNEFVHYQHDPQNPNSLSSNKIWRIYEDSTGILWIGADAQGLNQFDRTQNKFVHYQHDPLNPNSLSHNKTSFIYEDSTQTLWIGTDGGGLNQFDRERKQFIHYRHDPLNPNSLSDDIIWSIYEDSTGVLWIATDNGLNQFDREQNQFIHYQHDPHNPESLSKDYVMSLYEDRAGALWIGTDGGGLNKFDRRRDKFKHYFHEQQTPNRLSDNLVSSIYQDQKGFLWVGTFAGLNKFDPNRQKITHYFHDLQNPHSLSDNEIWSIYEDRRGNLWIGTYGGGLNQYNRQNDSFIHYAHDPENHLTLSHNQVRTFYEDKRGTFWIGTREGLNRFDRDRNQFFHYHHEPDNPNSLSDESILSIYEDRQGLLWIGTQLGGLNQFDHEKNQFIRYEYDPENPDTLSNNEVSAIYEDAKGRLWIATLGGGLNQFNRETQTFTHYREKDGLANDVVYGILEDKQGDLWLSTNNGLSKFNPESNTFRNYDVLDGLQSKEFRSAYHKNSRGELFFGGINGFNVFYPEKVKDNPYIPPVVITDFKIFNESVKIGHKSPLHQDISLTENLKLSYKQSFFSFEFAALNFLQPSKNEYAYRLEGLENEWNEVGSRRQAYYTSVPHGTYTFRVKGSNNDGVWNEKGAAIQITILPPPWKTWWAYSLYVITILAILVTYIRAQKRKLREKQLELEREKEIAAQLKEADRMKDEFLANTSHELRTPLNGIIGIAESLIEGAAGQVSQQLHSNLAMIVSSGRRLTNLVNDILDYSKLKKKEFDLQLQTIDMRTIADLVLALSQPLIGHKKLELLNNIPINLTPIKADENRIQQILYNLVGNAIKFTDSGTITISAEIITGLSPCEKDDIDSKQVPCSQLAITVSDTGIGIPEEKLGRIFEAFEQADGSTSRVYGGTGLGLAVTQQLVKLHGGEMHVQSQVGVGSQFIFTLPIDESSVEESEIEATQSLASLMAKESMTANLSPETQVIPTDIVPISEDIGENISDAQTGTTIAVLPQGQYTIWIVDDEAVNRQVLVNFLSLQNYILYQAADGLEALSLIENGEKPDLILLDIMMPHKTGYDVTRRIREIWQADELPIILLTAKNQVADLVIGLESGANDYLTKPISKDELLARIKTHLHILQLKEEALQLAKENEERLRQFLEAVPVGVGVLDADGQPHYINQKAQDILGKGVIEEVNVEQFTEVYQIFKAGTNQHYPFNKLPLVRALIGESTTADDLEIHQGEKIIPIESWGTPIFDEQGKVVFAITVLQDITERKQAMEARERFTQELFQLNKAYERFVPREFLSLLDKKSILDVNLGDQVEKEVTILFCDIREFTSISEKMTPKDIFEFINAYLGQMEPIIIEHHGIIDKFIGDAIMALFPTSADDAVRGAIAMLKRLSEYNELLERGGFKPMRIGIGINTGHLMLGTVGGQNRMDTTVIADAVNLASRVEGLTKTYGTPLLITEHTYRKLSDPLAYHVRVIDAVKVKGKSEIVTVYEIYDAQTPEMLSLKDQSRNEFEEGFVLYHDDAYEHAQAFFQNILQLNNNDEAACIYLQRCQKILSMRIPSEPTILVVEDTDFNARILSHFLNKNNFKVSLAKSGEEALQVIQHEKPHLILLDVMMPGIDGFETCQRLKADPQNQEIPIIFMTALTDAVDKIKGFQLGAVDYITKPFQQEEALVRINTQLQISHLQKQLQAKNIELETKNLELKKQIDNLKWGKM